MKSKKIKNLRVDEGYKGNKRQEELWREWGEESPDLEVYLFKMLSPPLIP